MEYDIDAAYEDRFSYPDPDEGNDEGMDSDESYNGWDEPCDNRFEACRNDPTVCAICGFDKAEHCIDREQA